MGFEPEIPETVERGANAYGELAFELLERDVARQQIVLQRVDAGERGSSSARTLGETLGWHWGFGAAGVGMVIGLLVYIGGIGWLPDQSAPAAGAAASATASEPLARADLVRRLWLLAGVAGAVIVFRTAYEQVGNTVALWIGIAVDRVAGGLTIPMTWFQSINALFVVLLTPPLILYWKHRAERGRELSALVRMSIGAGIVALSYALLGLVAWGYGAALASWAWPIMFMIVLTFGELWILPVGLGLFGRLAPAGYAATTIAAWFFAGFVGNILAGLLGSTWIRLGAAWFFAMAALVSVVAGLLLLALDRPARAVARLADK